MMIGKLRGPLLTAATYVVASTRDAKPMRLMAWAAAAYLKGYENCSFKISLNGEQRVLERLKQFHPRVFFDVGANRGDWTAHVTRIIPSVTVHCFEIAPQTFDALQTRFGGADHIHLNAYGLLDKAGTVVINYSAAASSNTSVFETIETRRHAYVRTAAQVDTGDRYFEMTGEERIHFLKIDVEGAEVLVLRGFSNALKEQRIDCIQFEYGHAPFTLREYYDMFERYGYTVGKIFPRYCDFGPYARIREFIVANYIAVRGERRDLINALSSRR